MATTVPTHHPPNVAALLDRIASLVVERQELRARSASAAALEQNRRELVDLQRELSRALIAQHARAPERDAA